MVTFNKGNINTFIEGMNCYFITISNKLFYGKVHFLKKGHTKHTCEENVEYYINKNILILANLFL